MADPPRTTLEAIFEKEHELLQLAPQRYGAHFKHGCDATGLLSTFVTSVSADREIFLRYMSQVKKHHTLALMSAARLHVIQSRMNLRQVLESAANAAYALCNPALENFFVGPPGTPARPAKIISGRAYKWMAKALPDESEALKAAKERINSTTAHSNLVYSQGNFRYAPGRTDIAETPFFDVEDDYHVKANLWLIANTAIGIIGLVAASSQLTRGVVFRSDFATRFQALMDENERLKAEFLATDRYKAAMPLSNDKEREPG